MLVPEHRQDAIRRDCLRLREIEVQIIRQIRPEVCENTHPLSAIQAVSGHCR